MLRSLIHVDLTYMQGDRCGSIYILLHTRCPAPQASFVENVFTFFIVHHWLHYQKSCVHSCVDLGLGLLFEFMDQPVFMPIPCSFCY